jgi:hypothetical protein
MRPTLSSTCTLTLVSVLLFLSTEAVCLSAGCSGGSPRGARPGGSSVTSDAPFSVKLHFQVFADPLLEGHAAEDGSAWKSVKAR